MLTLHVTSQYRKDLKKALKSGRDASKLKDVTDRLLNQQPLEAKHRDHQLSGEYKDCRDCHLEPDWLLIYQSTPTALILIRTGSHSEIFR